MKCPRCRLCEMRIEKRSGGEVTRKCPGCGQEIAEKAQEPFCNTHTEGKEVPEGDNGQ